MLGFKKVAYESKTNVEPRVPEINKAGARPKYYPRDWVSANPSSETARTGQTAIAFNQLTDSSVLNAKAEQISKGRQQIKVSKTYNKAQDMIEEGRRSPIAQIFSFRDNVRPLRAIHNPTRKMYESGYSQPLQMFAFAKTRQQNAPSAQRAINRTNNQAQPNIKFPQSISDIPTGMPWQIPQ